MQSFGERGEGVGAPAQPRPCSRQRGEAINNGVTAVGDGGSE